MLRNSWLLDIDTAVIIRTNTQNLALLQASEFPVHCHHRSAASERTKINNTVSTSTQNMPLGTVQVFSPLVSTKQA